jgi:hypothetical protein
VGSKFTKRVHQAEAGEAQIAYNSNHLTTEITEMVLPSISLPRGYILSTTAPVTPPGHTTRHLHQYYLTTGPEMPVYALEDRTGATIGWLLGWPVTSDAQIVSTSYTIDGANPEAALYELGGTWLSIITSIGRVYLDPIGVLGLVYSPQLQRAAPTSAWMPESPFDCSLVEALNIPTKESHWYPFDLSPRVGVYRLMPNHYLDLDTWAARRHWPAAPLPEVDPAGAVHIIGDLGERMMRAYAAHHPYMGLTAGRDSRMLLACARPVAKDIEYFTLAHPDRSAQVDNMVAQQMAGRFSLPHSVDPFLPTDAQELEQWQVIVDRTVGGRVWQGARSARQKDTTRLTLVGYVGEVARAYYWRYGDTESTLLTREVLMRRLKLPICDATVAAAERWLAKAPVRNTLQLLDLFYIEAKLGPWAASPTVAIAGPRVVPLAHREIVAQILALPPRYKWSNQLAADVILERWPDLLAVPFNAEVGVQAMLRALKRKLKRIEINWK